MIFATIALTCLSITTQNSAQAELFGLFKGPSSNTSAQPFMIDPATGIDPVARRLMKITEERKLPRMLVINKIDNADDIAALELLGQANLQAKLVRQIHRRTLLQSLMVSPAGRERLLQEGEHLFELRTLRVA